MDTRSADLIALKIDRAARPDPPSRRFPRWLLRAARLNIVNALRGA